MFARGKLLVVAAILAASFIAAPASGRGHEGTRLVAAKWPQKGLHYKYLHSYWSVTRKFGRSRAGRNIVTQGVKVGKTTRDPTNHEIAVSYRRLRAWDHPEILARMVMRSGDPHPPPAHVGKPVIISAGMPDCTWVPESHGDYGAHNPSGAGGKYQMMPSLWHAYGGTGNAWEAPPAEQEMVARRVYDALGTQPWSAAAGGNC